MSASDIGQTSRARLYARYVSTHCRDVPQDASDAWIQRHLIPRLPPSRDARIIDVGCGAGQVVKLTRAAGYRQMHGIDMSEEQVALSRRRGVDGVELGDFQTHLHANPCSYDAIIALDVLEHFEPGEVLSVLDLVCHALKPGGSFFARTPNGCSPFMGRYRYGDFTHGTVFTDRSLRQLLRSAELDVACFMPVNPVPHGVISAARFVTWQVIATLLKFCLAVEIGTVRGHIVTQNLVVIAQKPPDQPAPHQRRAST